MPIAFFLLAAVAVDGARGPVPEARTQARAKAPRDRLVGRHRLGFGSPP